MVVLVTCGTVHECGHFLCRQCNLRHLQVATRGQAQSLWQTPNICETHNYSLCPLYLQPHWALYAFCLCTVNRTCTKSQCTSLSKMLSTEKKHNTQWKVPLLLLFDLFAVPWALDSKPEFSDKRGRYLIPVWFSPSGIRSSKQVPGVPFYHFQSARNAKMSPKSKLCNSTQTVTAETDPHWTFLLSAFQDIWSRHRQDPDNAQKPQFVDAYLDPSPLKDSTHTTIIICNTLYFVEFTPYHTYQNPKSHRFVGVEIFIMF